MTQIMELTDFRLKMHQYVYNDDCINILLSMINEQFELFNCEYDCINKKIELKIKKTNIKKISNYSHTTQFYYSIINQIFIRFFLDEAVYNKIHMSNDCMFLETYSSIISDQYSQKISMLYNITAILDNVITLYL